MDNKDYIRVLLYSYYTTLTGWGVLISHWAIKGSLGLELGVLAGLRLQILGSMALCLTFGPVREAKMQNIKRRQEVHG